MLTGYIGFLPPSWKSKEKEKKVLRRDASPTRFTEDLFHHVVQEIEKGGKEKKSKTNLKRTKKTPFRMDTSPTTFPKDLLPCSTV